MSPELKDLLTVSLSGLSILTNLGMFVYLRRIDTRKASETRIRESEARADERHRAILADIEALEDRLEPRIAFLERSVETTLDHDDLRELYDKVNRVAEETAGLNGEMKELSQTLRTLTAQLFQRGLN
jgi:hypothetical protein